MVAVETELPIVRAPPSADAIPVALRQRGGSPRQVLALTLIGTLVLAVFASGDLSSWLDRMGDRPGLAPLQHAAAHWNGAMQGIGLGAPSDALRGLVRRLLDWQWRAQR
jgi:hypothetical protein